MNPLSKIDKLLIKIESLYFKILCKIVYTISNIIGFKSTIDPTSYSLISKSIYRNFSIIIQGPIEDKSLLLLKRLIYQYNKIVGLRNIIVSASFISEKSKNYLEINGIRYVEVSPNPRGYRNILVQSRSVLEGLALCNTDLVVRTRLDQFISEWSFIDTYMDLILENRIMACGYTLMDPIFHIGDMFQYGKKSTLINIWSNISKEKLVENIRSQMFLTTKNPSYIDSGELYFGLALAKYYNLKITQFNYIKLLSNNMIIVSNQDIGMQWAKYNTLSDFRRLSLLDARGMIDHIKWIGLKNKYGAENQKN